LVVVGTRWYSDRHYKGGEKPTKQKIQRKMKNEKKITNTHSGVSNSDSARKMVQIHILDDLFGVNLAVLEWILYFVGCALVGTNFLGGVGGGVGGGIWIFGWWKNGRTVFGEFWDIG
jgi:hypothetical protein